MGDSLHGLLNNFTHIERTNRRCTAWETFKWATKGQTITSQNKQAQETVSHVACCKDGKGPEALQWTAWDTQKHTVRVEAEGGCQQTSLPCGITQGLWECTHSNHGYRENSKKADNFNITCKKKREFCLVLGSYLNRSGQTVNHQQPGRLQGRTRPSCNIETP